MKKILFLSLLVLIAFACKKQQKTQLEDNIFTSNYPLKLILQEIAGNDISVECLVPPGISPHLFEPKISDIQKLEKAKIFFYTSDLLENWISQNIQNKVALIDLLPKDKILYFADNKTIDPHFWTDPLSVSSIIDTLAKIIAKIYPNQKDNILQNASNFKYKLLELDKTVDSILTPVKGRYVFLFHPSFNYFIKRYGLLYGGSIEEIPGSEPTPTKINMLIQKIHQTKTKSIFIEPQLNEHPAEVIAEMVGTQLYELDPLGSEQIHSFSELIINNAKTILKALK